MTLTTALTTGHGRARRPIEDGYLHARRTEDGTLAFWREVWTGVGPTRKTLPVSDDGKGSDWEPAPTR